MWFFYINCSEIFLEKLHAESYSTPSTSSINCGVASVSHCLSGDINSDSP